MALSPLYLAPLIWGAISRGGSYQSGTDDGHILEPQITPISQIATAAKKSVRSTKIHKSCTDHAQPKSVKSVQSAVNNTMRKLNNNLSGMCPEKHKTARVSTEVIHKCGNFAFAFELQRRVKAAAQHSSSKLDSAFALHFTCHCI